MVKTKGRIEEIVLEKEKEIRYIYHIGDIHIRRNNEREREYREVFKRLIDKIEEDEETLVVCTGDIFHEGLSASAIILAKDLFSGLCDKCDVIVLRGNHDETLRSNRDAIDNMTAGMYKLQTKNRLYPMNKTGVYRYWNIVFGYTDIYEEEIYNLEEGLRGIKIGLWHGTIRGSKTETGRENEWEKDDNERRF